MRSLYYVRLDISFLSTSDGVKGVYTHAYKMNLILRYLSCHSILCG